MADAGARVLGVAVRLGADDHALVGELDDDRLEAALRVRLVEGRDAVCDGDVVRREVLRHLLLLRDAALPAVAGVMHAIIA